MQDSPRVGLAFRTSLQRPRSLEIGSRASFSIMGLMFTGPT